MKTGFSAQAHGAVLDFTGDDEVDMRKKKGETGIKRLTIYKRPLYDGSLV